MMWWALFFIEFQEYFNLFENIFCSFVFISLLLHLSFIFSLFLCTFQAHLCNTCGLWLPPWTFCCLTSVTALLSESNLMSLHCRNQSRASSVGEVSNRGGHLARSPEARRQANEQRADLSLRGLHRTGVGEWFCEHPPRGHCRIRRVCQSCPRHSLWGFLGLRPQVRQPRQIVSSTKGDIGGPPPHVKAHQLFCLMKWKCRSLHALHTVMKLWCCRNMYVPLHYRTVWWRLSDSFFQCLHLLNDHLMNCNWSVVSTTVLHIVQRVLFI